MLSDPIADMLSEIKNAYMAKKGSVEVSYSKVKEGVIKILLKYGFIANYKINKLKKPKKTIFLALKYRNRQPAITDIKRVSKPSCRLYAGRKKLPYVLSGIGISIVSTSQGVMAAREARKKQLGGEVICKVW